MIHNTVGKSGNQRNAILKTPEFVCTIVDAVNALNGNYSAKNPSSLISVFFSIFHFKAIFFYTPPLPLNPIRKEWSLTKVEPLMEPKGIELGG